MINLVSLIIGLLGTTIGVLSLLAGIVSIIISYKAYIYAKNANEDTVRLLHQNLELLQNSGYKDDKQFKMKMESDIIENALSSWNFGGTPVPFLKNKYKELEEYGWTESDFEKIYTSVVRRKKNREPKRGLFEND